MNNNILKIYDQIKSVFKEIKEPEAISHLFQKLFNECEHLLSSKEKVLLNSQIINKEYFSYGENRKLTRPINKNLYDHATDNMVNSFFEKLKINSITDITAENITSIVYRIAISFCATIDIIKESDQKLQALFLSILWDIYFP
jgi:hypothetical protein